MSCSYFLFFPGSILKVKVKVTQSCLTLCDPVEYTVRGILQARILEWVAYSSRSSWPRNWIWVSCIAGRFFTNWAIREAQVSYQGSIQVQSWETVYSRNLSISSRFSTSLVYSYLSWSHESLYFCDVSCNFSFFIPDFIDLRPLFLGGESSIIFYFSLFFLTFKLFILYWSISN